MQLDHSHDTRVIYPLNRNWDAAADRERTILQAAYLKLPATNLSIGSSALTVHRVW